MMKANALPAALQPDNQQSIFDEEISEDHGQAA
jgi:hypothetical protein